MSIIKINNVGFTSEGGIAVQMINKTGSNSIKGYCIDPHSENNSFQLVPVNVPDCIGIVYDDGIPDGELCWIVFSGVAHVYFQVNSTASYLARTPITADSGVSGQAISELLPTSPFATDKHFCEIGHIVETRADPGLALCVLHFN